MWCRFFWGETRASSGGRWRLCILGQTSVTTLWVGFVTFFFLFLSSALFYKNNSDAARKKSSKCSATDGEAFPVNAHTLPFRYLVGSPSYPVVGGYVFLQFALECGTKSRDEDRVRWRLCSGLWTGNIRHFLTMTLSTIYLFPPWLVKPLSSVTQPLAAIQEHRVWCRSWYFVFAGWRLQAASASPVGRVDGVLTLL